MRHPYKMRAVVGHCNVPDTYSKYCDPGRMLSAESIHRLTTRDVLECGHLRPAPSIDSTVDALGAAMRLLAPDEPFKRRCYECAKEPVT